MAVVLDCLGVVLLVLGVEPGVGGMRGRRCDGFGCCGCCSWIAWVRTLWGVG